MTEPPHHDPIWRRSLFTERRHVVGATADRMTFHGLPIVWSLCGRATIDEPNPPRTDLSPCDRCLSLTWGIP